MLTVVTGASGHVGANLVPRARTNHAWYKEHFCDYPAERKALLPGIW
jgi:3-oxo-5-alpha-steroid 4-dehydrogenase 1